MTMAILECENYKMFQGTMIICGKQAITGVWLYKPQYDCWYCNDHSYPADCCEIKTVEGTRQQIPVQDKGTFGGYAVGKCPNCGASCNHEMKYCDQCGQAFDWGD